MTKFPRLDGCSESSDAFTFPLSLLSIQSVKRGGAETVVGNIDWVQGGRRFMGFILDLYGFPTSSVSKHMVKV